jgi:hypothetical protein
VGLTDTTLGIADGVGSPRIRTGVAEMRGDSLEGILRLVRTAGPKHDGSSLKSSREQFRNVGHGRLAIEFRVGSHVDLTNIHRLLHVFTLVGVLVEGSTKHNGK